MSPVINATELLKCRQQVTRTVPQPSLRAVCRQLLEYEGPHGLLCGYTACLPRNILGNATMFGLFDLLRAAIGTAKAALAGMNLQVHCCHRHHFARELAMLSSCLRMQRKRTGDSTVAPPTRTGYLYLKVPQKVTL